MPHPMTRLCDRFRLKEFDFHSFALRRRVVDMSGGPRRGSDSPDLMYLSGKTIHTFWAPRQGFQRLNSHPDSRSSKPAVRGAAAMLPLAARAYGCIGTVRPDERETSPISVRFREQPGDRDPLLRVPAPNPSQP